MNEFDRPSRKNQFVAVTSKQLHKFLRNRPIQQDLINAGSQINAGGSDLLYEYLRYLSTQV